MVTLCITRSSSTYTIVIVCLCIIIVIVCLCVVNVICPCIAAIHPHAVAVRQLLVATLPLATWPLLLMWEKKRGRGGTLLTLINMNSDDETCHHCLDDVPGHFCPSSLFICWAGDVALPCCRHCWGGSGSWMMIVVGGGWWWSWWWWCGGGWEGNSLFVDAFSCHYLALIKNIKQVNIF